MNVIESLLREGFNIRMDDDLKRKIEALKRTFTGTLDTRLGELEAALARLRADAPLADQVDTIKALLEQAHKIAGSAGTFGYAQVSVIASETEQLCESIIKGRHGADQPALGTLAAKVAALRVQAAL
jgi:HPt (histidine-containing phosphotransfer) domain-containing protein